MTESFYLPEWARLGYEEAFAREQERIMTDEAWTAGYHRVRVEDLPQYTPEGYIDARRDDGGVPCITTLR